ncbi:hypothetical protein [Paludibaculum fermentans]|uniref:hypothetical protein n=1 Tax=Paludibaculum fermentans TaxID=1473598 RepID=UPI003EBC5C8B
MTLQCPKCTSRAIRPSNYKTGWERLLALVYRHPFRCKHCGHRFFEFATKGQRKTMFESNILAKAEQAFAGLHSEF